MCCDCNNFNSIHGNDVLEFVKKLNQLSVDGYKWKSLYRCNECKTFWEESYSGGRWNGEPVLTKVNSNYVLREWGEKYL